MNTPERKLEPSPLRQHAFAALLFAGVYFASPAFAQIEEQEEIKDDPAYSSMRLLANAIQLIRQDYVDESRIEYDNLVQSALRGMLAELDPHSQFLDAEAFKSMQEDTRSEFGGLGIQVGLRNGHLVVVSPMEGTPAFEAGLLPGDRIVKIEGKTTDRLTLPEAVDLLRGEVGEKITLTIQRPPDMEILDFTLERAVIKIKSVRDAQILPPQLTGRAKIGYVRLVAFSEPTARELGEALDKLEAENAAGLILDLRFNPGGLLTSAIDVCAQFLPAGTEVVSTAGRTPGRPFQTSESASRNRTIPLVILINSSSASGAEIVAGALKDLGRAVLIGETTFGKGSVQGVSAMGDGSAIRLTTATYLTPSRQPIHEVGVRPHILSVLQASEERELMRTRQRVAPAESDADAETSAPSGIEPEKDSQLRRAIEVMRGVLLSRNRKAEEI